MRDLGNKLFLFAACSYLLWLTEMTAFTAAVFCISIIVSCLCTYWEGSGLPAGLILAVSFLCLALPQLGLYVPLLLYDAVPAGKKYCFAGLAAASLSTFIWLPDVLYIPFFLILTGGFLLSFYSSRIRTLVQNLHNMRDESTEIQMILQERNQALIQNQNYELHLATLSERNRIAREIHDNVGHLLTRSLLQTGALKVVNQQPALEEPLNTLNDTLNTAMTSIRTSVHDLHDDAVDIEAVLKELIAGTKHPVIQLDYDIESRLPRELKYCFISIIKEGLHNIQKHSDANTAWIRLREHPGFYQLVIRDNGSLKKLPAETDGIGLSNMRERVQGFGGNIRFSIREGFCITVSILKKQKNGGSYECIDH